MAMTDVFTSAAYHAVRSSKDRLREAGFEPIKERQAWAHEIRPGGKYYLTRNGSSIVAFAVGKKWKAGNPIAMVGAHTDSPCLRVKPVSKKEGDGFLQVGVETYGGGLWHTWFDRDLSIAGRVMVKKPDGTFVQQLIKHDKPILRVPTLAVHLDRQETFSFNKETQLFPIAGLVAAELNRTGRGRKDQKDEKKGEDDGEASSTPLKALSERHHPRILEIIAEEAGVKPGDVIDFEMVLYDTQKSCIGGINDELIFSARLDNLVMSFCSVVGLINSLSDSKALEEDSSIRLISLFDHEEIGSMTAQGADSNLLPSVIRRLSVVPGMGQSGQGKGKNETDPASSTAYEETLAKSFLISADMAHSVNPNYTGKYETDHRPHMNEGVVVKINANNRYATNSPGIVLLQEIAKRGVESNVPLQLFVVRNDSSCGSTIGPMLAAAMGTRTLDLGNPQLSMHSIRECCGVDDIYSAISLFSSFFLHYPSLEEKIFVD
ncbi:MAG: hypothetical protein M4579_004442 [Chaenotheca gracillima]|nr:MAG: hypothetical protein M4579_004442 [Chaenotheca gracillima]